MSERDIRDIDKNMKENIALDSNDKIWYDLNNEYLLGTAFHNNFERLKKDFFVSANIETLKRHPAGLNIIFKTNSTKINIKAMLSGQAYMSHMTAVGTIGFSIYVKNKNKWVYLASTKINNKDYDIELLKDMDKKTREFRVYFPLYQALNQAYIGVEKNSYFEFVKLNQEKLVIYGTSISQGGCATRPGMDYGSIMGRMMNLDVINLGFSGSCKIEKEMVEIINEINNKKYLILEVESNSPSPEILKENLSYFLNNLINKDSFDIYLISHFDEGNTLINKKYKLSREVFFDVQKNMPNIKFVNGTKLIKELGCEGSVDGVHLTDLGFYFVAKNLIKIIKKENN